MNSQTVTSQHDHVPAWLAAVNADSMASRPLPLREILNGALYYPSCGTDGDPVRYMGPLIQSFIYVDYGYDRTRFLEALRQQPFSGYRVLGSRSVSEQELDTRGWSLPPLSEEEMERAHDAARNLRGAPFCEWVVLERLPMMAPQHGPRRFSMLYLCADGVAAFQALFVDKALRPGAIAVIQPGHGFGRNWTDFTDPQGPLARVVASNPAGLPQYMLAGGLGKREDLQSLRWPQYARLIRWYPYHSPGEVGIWTLEE